MIRSFFNLTRYEKKAGLIFACFLLALMTIRLIVNSNGEQGLLKVSQREGQNIEIPTNSGKNRTDHQQEVQQKRRLFKKSSEEFKVDEKENEGQILIFDQPYFDPNLLSVLEWEEMGFSRKQAAVIYNFVKNSGGITRKEQLKKIYVVTERQKKDLMAHVQITKKKWEDVLRGDLIKVRGIGKVLSDRIIKYRDKLGGFAHEDQLQEVYGLDSSIVMELKQRFRVGEVKLLPVNKLGLNDLKAHPYVSKADALNMIAARSERRFKSGDDLKLLFDDSLKWLKISPYVSYE